MTQEQYDELRRDLVELKVDMGVVKTKLAHIEQLADTSTIQRRFFVTTGVSVLAVVISVGAIVWT